MNRRFLKGGDAWPGIHSYAVLRFNGKKVDIEYVDQDGVVGFRETWA